MRGTYPCEHYRNTGKTLNQSEVFVVNYLKPETVVNNKNFRMDPNIYSKYNNLSDNFGGILVHWMRKVLEIKIDKTRGSVKNEQSYDRNLPGDKNKERLERNSTFSRY